MIRPFDKLPAGRSTGRSSEKDLQSWTALFVHDRKFMDLDDILRSEYDAERLDNDPYNAENSSNDGRQTMALRNP